MKKKGKEEERKGDERRGISKRRKKNMDRPVEATHEEQHRRHFYRVFSSVLRIRSRDRARNDITALYELHLRNDGMPYEPAQVFLF